MSRRLIILLWIKYNTWKENYSIFVMNELQIAKKANMENFSHAAVNPIHSNVLQASISET